MRHLTTTQKIIIVILVTVGSGCIMYLYSEKAPLSLSVGAALFIYSVYTLERMKIR